MPGTLAELYGAILKQEPQGILGAARFNPLMMAKALRQQEANPRPALASLMNYPQTWQQFGDNIQANYPTDSPAAVRQAAFEAAKNAGPLATVYHGSPHKFDAFDSSKIGTGEGAQAYGHGLYFAETPDVAKTYAPRDFAREEKLMGFYKKAEKIGNYEAMEVLESALLHESPSEILRRFSDKSSGYTSKHASEAKWLHDWMNKNPSTMGGLYKVDLPDDQIAKMLDWDKPLSQQPESVRKAIERISPKNRSGQSLVSLDASGEELIRALGGGEGASNLLREAGIPGIRYLDGGSRGAGTGTSNFVVFPGNEGALKILARE